MGSSPANADVTVCIATIPPRVKMLRSALSSVVIQTLQPTAIIVEYDHFHDGAATTKNRALFKVETEWFAWLDDDDQFLPGHLETLWNAHFANQWADIIYPWYIMEGRSDPIADRFGKPFDEKLFRRMSYVPTTVLAHTKIAQSVGGFKSPPHDNPNYDDYGLFLDMYKAGAKFLHVPERTWIWNVKGQNTSGQPWR